MLIAMQLPSRLPTWLAVSAPCVRLCESSLCGQLRPAGLYLSRITGALTKKSEHNGWRNFYVRSTWRRTGPLVLLTPSSQWIQTAMWGATVICLLVGYRPPKRHSFLDNLTMKQKISRLDLPGMFLVSLVSRYVTLTFTDNTYSLRVLSHCFWQVSVLAATPGLGAITAFWFHSCLVLSSSLSLLSTNGRVPAPVFSTTSYSRGAPSPFASFSSSSKESFCSR